MPSLDFIAKQMEWRKPKHPDLEAALATAVQEAVSKVLADHAPPPESRPNPRMANLLRPSTPMPPPVPRPAAEPAKPSKPRLPVPIPVRIERDGNNRIRALNFTGPDGVRHETLTTRDELGRLASFSTDGIVTHRIKRDANGRVVEFVLEQAPDWWPGLSANQE